jgi:hypothetical protein
MLSVAPVLVTGVIEGTSRDQAVSSADRTVMAHAVVRVLRSYPPSTLAAGESIRLDYAALPDGASPMSGPAVAEIRSGDILALPLKLNPDPTSPWRLISDEGLSLTIPAIARAPRFPGPPLDGRAFLLREMASAMLDGTRENVFAAAHYASSQRITGPGQKPIGPELVALVQSQLPPGDDRWPTIAALTLGGMGVPRPGVADLRAGKDLNGGQAYAGSFITAVLQALGPSGEARQRLIHQLLASSDIASWGVGMTVPEFSQDPGLVGEMRQMLRARKPGVLSVARSILIAGQKSILPDATALSWYYISTPGANPEELQAACWVIRDFGTDEQFDRLAAEIRDSQYRNRDRYDALWRNILWSDNQRERAVLAILLKDDRIYQGQMRYSEVARGELNRIGQNKP